MRTTAVLPLGLLIALATSCGKEAPDVDQDYVGFWKSVDTDCRPWLRIESTGDGRYSAYFPDEDCKHNQEHTGLARIKGGQLHVGSWHERITLDPTPIDSVDLDVDWEYGPGEHWSTTKLELSGQTYYKLPR